MTLVDATHGKVGSMTRKLLISVVLASVLYLLHSCTASACCTSEPQLIAAYNGTPAVFVGTVITLRITKFVGGPGDSREILVTYLSVEEAFKGVPTPEVAVMTTVSGECSFPFEVGKQYLIFAGSAWWNPGLDIGFGPAHGLFLEVPMRAPTLAVSGCGQSGIISSNRDTVAMIRNHVRGTPHPKSRGNPDDRAPKR
jgi:hypothetical protein